MEAQTLPLFRHAAAHGDRVAIVANGAEHRYTELLSRAESFARALLDSRSDLEEARVAFLVSPGFEYAVVQWGIWMAGGIAVPLATSHPPAELEYVVEDSEATILVAESELIARLEPIATSRGLPILPAGAGAAGGEAMPRLTPERRAMILYTSGTMSRPKGVVTTHGNIQAQVETLVDAWGWSSEDRILLVLPLHHVHGIINVLTCALRSGARCTIHPSFDAEAVWDALAAGELTLFMAVPTIYSRLVGSWEQATPELRRSRSEGCRALRLMVSGSAALPVSVLERWRAISGHTLLERYGMTEIGMALSNPLEGERRPGHVGLPLPGVEVRLVGDDGRTVEPGTPGEIQVRGPSVFLEYWRRSEATEESFVDGWFRTGDVAVIEMGYYRILGRSSVDILKTGGYKVSALEIEELLRTHPGIREVAVVGLADEEWGERVAAAVVPEEEGTLEADALRAWAGERLAPYKVPRSFRFVAELPRNAMGKVTKPEVKRLWTS
jgi:malonyl-CoA/methylmalonyl-CoA synthetase